MATTTGSFTIEGWDERPWHDDGGVRIASATVRKAFTGGIEGTSLAEVMTCAVGGEGTAYVAFEVLDVALDGRRGTFVLQHDAGSRPDGPFAMWSVVPGSGTGELAGLVGTGTYRHDETGATVVLDYALD